MIAPYLQKIHEIFEENGEDAFRDVETEILSQISPYTRTVVGKEREKKKRGRRWLCTSMIIFDSITSIA